MGNFENYIEIEANLIKRKNLTEKYFNGRTLEQRTKIENIDYFDKYCGGKNTYFLLGNSYCPASFSNQNFACPYLNPNLDINKLKTCMYHEKKH